MAEAGLQDFATNRGVNVRNGDATAQLATSSTGPIAPAGTTSKKPTAVSSSSSAALAVSEDRPNVGHGVDGDNEVEPKRDGFSAAFGLSGLEREGVEGQASDGGGGRGGQGSRGLDEGRGGAIEVPRRGDDGSSAFVVGNGERERVDRKDADEEGGGGGGGEEEKESSRGIEGEEWVVILALFSSNLCFAIEGPGRVNDFQIAGGEVKEAEGEGKGAPASRDEDVTSTRY